MSILLPILCENSETSLFVGQSDGVVEPGVDHRARNQYKESPAREFQGI